MVTVLLRIMWGHRVMLRRKSQNDSTFVFICLMSNSNVFKRSRREFAQLVFSSNDASNASLDVVTAQSKPGRKSIQAA